MEMINIEYNSIKDLKSIKKLVYSYDRDKILIQVFAGNSDF